MDNSLNAHSRLLTAAARSILRPLGLVQMGRSRAWLDDHIWWVGVVEFQPNGFGKGSYLNVSCMWLWNVKSYISFDEGGRVAELSVFHDEEKFRHIADDLARKAAKEILRYRSLFPNVRGVSEYYKQNNPTAFWPSFHAGVACALSGEAEKSQWFFERVIETTEDDRDWVNEARLDARNLSVLAPDREKFQLFIAERVRQTRELLKLPSVHQVVF